MAITVVCTDSGREIPDPRSRDRLVSIYRGAQTGYPQAPPFNPPRVYPEFSGRGQPMPTDPTNHVFESVREALRLLGLDAARFGQPDWNPLVGLIHHGDRVLVKPNWVSHQHAANDSWQQLITHGSVIRAVTDYIQLALRGRGEIVLADGPMLDANFEEICQRTGATKIRDFYRELKGAVPLELVDLRNLRFDVRDAVVVARHPLPGDPRGTAVANLGRESALFGFRGEGRYYGADYDTGEVNRHHRGDVHEYLLSATAMSADVIVDIPKLKTHHKVGVTMALKGVVGLNCGRNWLPHRTQGTPQQGGDQFASSGLRQRVELAAVRTFEKASLRFPRAVPHLYRIAKRMGKHVFGESHATVRGGGWHGNDTLWRMVLDINRALMYGDRQGSLQSALTKRRFCVVDGIVAGEGLGPVSADPATAGVILAGQNPVAVDIAGAELMGFDYRRIPMLANALLDHPLPLVEFGADDVRLVSNAADWSGTLEDLRRAQPFAFNAPLGWDHFLEREPTNAAGVRDAGSNIA